MISLTDNIILNITEKNWNRSRKRVSTDQDKIIERQPKKKPSDLLYIPNIKSKRSESKRAKKRQSNTATQQHSESRTRNKIQDKIANFNLCVNKK